MSFESTVKASNLSVCSAPDSAPDFDKRGLLEHRPTVLIVDDHGDSLMYAQAAAEYLGYSVIGTRCGEKALTLASDRLPDIIFLDLLLDGIHGVEVLRQLQHNATTASIPTVAVTAMVTELERMKVSNPGFAAFLEKPYLIEDLASVFQSVRQEKKERLRPLQLKAIRKTA